MKLSEFIQYVDKVKGSQIAKKHIIDFKCIIDELFLNTEKLTFSVWASPNSNSSVMALFFYKEITDEIVQSGNFESARDAATIEVYFTEEGVSGLFDTQGKHGWEPTSKVDAVRSVLKYLELQ